MQQEKSMSAKIWVLEKKYPNYHALKLLVATLAEVYSIKISSQSALNLTRYHPYWIYHILLSTTGYLPIKHTIRGLPTKRKI